MKIYTPILGSVLLLTALGVTSCAPAANTDTNLSSESSNQETELPVRLVISSAEGVTVREAADGDELASFPLGTTPFLTPLGASGEVVVTDMTSGNTWVVDSGLKMVSHGDHEDLQVKEPSASSVAASGDTPTHVEHANGKVAIFYDGEGAAKVFTEHSLTGDSPAPFMTQTAVAPHHGVAIPRFDGLLMTVPGEETASGVAAYTEAGELIETFDTCPALHGSAILDTVAVIAPWEIPAGHGGVTPQLVVTAHHLYISDPAEQRVVELSRDGDSEPRVVNVGVAPSALAVIAPEDDSHTHS
ncbi:hypothetical protein [Leucobacter sp. W1478]|uniref:hypothetical protein n=1 Tax=Leucobacter sp. W1478 TaxID=3439065 RepID=UPI003F3CA1AB